MTKTAKNILILSFLLTLINLVSKGLGFIREMIFAYFYGLSKEYDIFLVSITLSTIINSTIYYLSQNYFIPIYNNKSKAGEAEQNRFFAFSLVVFGIISVIIVFLLIIFRSNVLNLLLGATSKFEYDLAEKIYLIFLFIIPINALFSIIAAYNQAKFSFLRISISYVLTNISVIAFIILFHNSLGILALPVSFLIGAFVQLVYVYFPIKNYIAINRVMWHNFISDSKNVTASLFIILLIEIIGLSYSFIDRYFYDVICVGGVSALNYAFNLTSLPTSIFISAIATVYFSLFSYNSGNNQNNKNADIYSEIMKYNFMIFIPLFTIFYFSDEVIIKLLFERGSFDSNATLMTASAFAIYAFGIPFITGYSIINKLFYSYNKIILLMLFVCLAFVIKIILSFLLITKYNFLALPVATSVSYFILFVVTNIYTVKKIIKVRKFYISRLFLYYSIFTLLVYLLIYPLNLLFNFSSINGKVLYNITLIIALFAMILIDDKNVRDVFLKFVKKYIKLNDNN